MTAPPAAGWYRDPTGRFASRYWDGRQWSDYVNSGGANLTDRMPEAHRTVPPAPGTVVAPAAPQTTPTVQVTQVSRWGVLGTLIGVALTIAAIVLVFALFLALSTDEASDTTGVPATTEAPLTTETPADTEAPVTTAPADE